MADKTIGELPGISYLDAGSLFVAEQQGEAVKVTGKQLTDFSNVETNAQVEQAKASAQAAKTAQAAAEAAILKGPVIQNGTWWVYNQTAGAYQDTGINATGPQGIPGPTSSVNGISPDNSGNITLTAGNVNAYSKTEADNLLQKKANASSVYTKSETYTKEETNTLLHKKADKDRVVNPNLLDNWYFGNPVNQRGQTEYTGDGYTIDRWRLGTDKNMALSISDDKLSIVTDTVDSYFNFDQFLEAKVFRVGATYTLSFLVDNYRNINQIYFSAGKNIFIFTDNLVTTTFTVNSPISSNPYVGIQFKTNTTTSILAAKLEIGDRQTLAHQDANGNWVLNEIPDYGEQLRRCQRYAIDLAASGDRTYGIVGVGVAVSQNEVQFMVPLPTTMRARPVAKFSGTWKFVHGTDANGGVSVTTISVDRLSTNTVVLNTFTNENLLTVGDTYMLWRSDDSNNSLLLSADL